MSVASPPTRHICPRCQGMTPPGQPICKRGHDCGTANVRAARLPAEVSELDRRYNQDLAELTARGVEQEARFFEDALKQRSLAVVNSYPGFVKRLAKETGINYMNYYERQDLGIDDPSPDQVTTNREMADAFSYPGYGDKLRFAALALNPRGLPNYGSISLILKTGLLEGKAALLERNSYHFAALHSHKAALGETFPFLPAPLGYRSDWQNRHKLAVTKHADDLQAGMKGDQFDGIVLLPGASRGEDRFIEVGIYDPFGLDEILEIHAPRVVLNPSSEEQDILEDAADCMEEKQIGWSWYDH